MDGSFHSLALAALRAPQNLTLDWKRYSNGNWCGLLTLDLTDRHFTGLEGVYVIWRAPDGAVVRVGQGAIADRLRTHVDDPEIWAHGLRGTLFVTWHP